MREKMRKKEKMRRIEEEGGSFPSLPHPNSILK